MAASDTAEASRSEETVASEASRSEDTTASDTAEGRIAGNDGPEHIDLSR